VSPELLVVGVREYETVHFKNAVISVGEVNLISPQDHHHVPCAISLPGHHVWLFELKNICLVHGHRLAAREARSLTTQLATTVLMSSALHVRGPVAEVLEFPLQFLQCGLFSD
jgi:hypothetical protein